MIKRQILELELDSRLNAADLQTHVSQLYRQKIVPLVDAYCSQFSDPEVIHRIDHLEIDLGDIDLANLDADYVQKAASALATELAKRLTQSPQPSSPPALTHQYDRAGSPTPVTNPAPADQRSPTSRPTANHIEPDATVPRPQPGQPDQRPSTAAPERSLATSRPLSAAQTSGSQAAQPLSPSQTQLELIQTFLTTGQLPWWSEPLTHQALVDGCMQLMAAAPQPFVAWLQTVLKSESVLQRVLYQFPEPVWLAILQLLAPEMRPEIEAYLTDIQKLIPKISIWRMVSALKLWQTLWQGLLLHLVLSPPSSQTPVAAAMPALLQANLLHLATQLQLNQRSLIQQIQRAIATFNQEGHPLSSQLPTAIAQFDLSDLLTDPSEPDAAPEQSVNASPTSAKTPLLLRPAPAATPPDDLYIQNAGLVILAPFLNRFLTTLNLVEANQFMSQEFAQRSALMLQYLIDDSLVSAESALSLNKLMCGLELSAPLPAQLTLTAIEAEECGALLTAIIQNWTALQNTSISGLQRAFLQRTGLLRRHHDGWRLQVEHQTHDILLDQLPWSIRVITLPWMPEILYVDW